MYIYYEELTHTTMESENPLYAVCKMEIQESWGNNPI